MRYSDEPRMSLNLNEDNSTMELVPEFLNVLMDTTLVVKVRRIDTGRDLSIMQLAQSCPAGERAALASVGISYE